MLQSAVALLKNVELKRESIEGEASKNPVHRRRVQPQKEQQVWNFTHILQQLAAMNLMTKVRQTTLLRIFIMINGGCYCCVVAWKVKRLKVIVKKFKTHKIICEHILWLSP